MVARPGLQFVTSKHVFCRESCTMIGMTNFVITRPEQGDLKKNPTSGLSEGRYWGRDDGPDSELRKRDGAKRRGNYVDSAEYHFADHAYRVKQTDGTLSYYSEPYSLNNNDFGDLAYLASNGWTVIVSDGPNRHSDKALLLEIRKAGS